METTTKPVKRFVCSFPGCPAAYNKQWKLDSHVCKHTGVRPHRCEQQGCGKSFCTASHLQRHRLTHSGEKPFACTVDGCSESFTTNANRARHVLRLHEQKKYACKVEGCGLEFRKNKQLKSHMCDMHTQLPTHCCTYQGCQMRFTCPSKLKRHEKVHQGYPCQEEGCTFTGSRWTDLQKHKKEQHRVLWRCEHCSKVFRDSWFLKQHQHVHADTRVVFRCPRDDCDRSFTTLFGLQSHITSFHEELHPFACTRPGCGKTFAMRQSLRRHSVVHDPERKKLERSKPKRSLASRLSGYKETKTVINKKHREPEAHRGSSLPGPVSLVSLLQDTSLLCSAAESAHGLSNALAAPLTT
ncbi:transcription factor IIIA-like [Cololabis saira]|uniref:transcription factor IIIA-like n=1 Tax=Cololabis saira TaxID=129043 RepID=UPI002AD3CC46|nr:transcription factor IIIA-like [Cololabis saira]